MSSATRVLLVDLELAELSDLREFAIDLSAEAIDPRLLSIIDAFIKARDTGRDCSAYSVPPQMYAKYARVKSRRTRVHS